MPAVTIVTRPTAGFGLLVAGRLGNAKRPADRVVLARGKLRKQLGRLLGRHPRGQHVDPVLKLGMKNPGNRLDRLALREYHLGKTAAAMAIQVNLGRSHVGNARILHLADEIGHRKLPGNQAGGKLFEQLSVHTVIISADGG